MTDIGCITLIGMFCILASGCRATPTSQRLAVGMTKNECFSLLQGHGIKPKENEGAYESPHRWPHCRYSIESSSSPDAVFMVMEQPPGSDDYRIEDMYLYRSYQTDALKPKAMRTGDSESLDSIQIDALSKWVSTGVWERK